MSFLDPKIETRQPKSQATPLSEELIQLLTGMVTSETGGGFAEGQKGISDFASARSSPEQFLELMGPLREMFDRETERQVSQTREGFSATGNRQSLGLAREEGRQRTERGTNLDALISDLFLKEQSNLLRAFESLRSPFIDFGKLGILPEDTFIKDPRFTTLTRGIGDLAKGGAAIAGATG